MAGYRLAKPTRNNYNGLNVAARVSKRRYLRSGALILGKTASFSACAGVLIGICVQRHVVNINSSVLSLKESEFVRWCDGTVLQ